MRPPAPSEPNRAAEFLASRIDFERTSSIPYGQRDFRLDRMRQLLERLGNPQHGLKIVHIAGTKGKGSTAAMLANILRAAGLRTGLYSSPHLNRVEERIGIDGADCTAAELADLVARIEPVVAEMDALDPVEPATSNRPTYFEIVTALALLRFAEQRVDAVVLEVGLGGRLDSTNVCQPLVSVITSISFDHTQQLGRTLAAIAGEKAGIIKDRVPVVSGVMDDEPRRVVIDVARAHQAPLVQLGVDFDFDYRPASALDRGDAKGRLNFRWFREHGELLLSELELSLPGRHQAANAALALAIACELRAQGWQIPDAALRVGLATTRWPGRIEVLSRRPTVVLDAAHNVASIEALVATLNESTTASRRILIFATTRDKDLRGMLGVLLPAFDEVILTRYWSNPRAVPLEELESLATEILPSRTNWRLCPDPATAWRCASDLAAPEDLICITGSFFIAGEVRAVIDFGRT